MNHIRKFESYKNKINKKEVTNETVFQMGDVYKVRFSVDVPKSMVNSYVKKVKEASGKNLRDFMGEMDLAEELVKSVLQTNLDVEKISSDAIIGGQSQPQAQPQGEVQVQTQAQTEAQPAESQPEGEFEEVEDQGQSQTQGEVQAQPETEESEEGEEELPA